MKTNKKSFGFPLLFLIFSLLLTGAAGVFFIVSNKAPKAQAADTPPYILPTVIIDAGHGGEDGGAVGVNGCFEKDVNLAIAKKLSETLTKMGFECILTRSEDVLLYDRNQDYEGKKKILDMQARLKIASEKENAIFVSIHQNSFPVEKYSGFQAYYSPNSPSSKELALTLENAVRQNLQPSNNRASKPSDGKIYLLDNLKCTAVLLECGFISNAAECDLLSTEEYRARFAQTVADAIAEYTLRNANKESVTG